MTNLLDYYSRIKSFPNGEAVARKLAQLYDCSLDPQYDYLPVARVVNALAAHGEEKLFGEILRKNFKFHLSP